MSTAEQLAEVRRGLELAESGIVRFSDSVSDEVWTKRPPSGGWSAAECIAHLTMTTDAYLDLFAAARKTVPGSATLPPKYGRGIGGRLLEWMLEPPARGKSKTLAAFVPAASAPKSTMIAEFTRSQKALLVWMKSVESVPLDKMIITSPFNSRLKYNAYATLRVIAAHQRRHLWQAERAARGIP
jgi:DinB superfamily